jgi:hypothetical protein
VLVLAGVVDEGPRLRAIVDPATGPALRIAHMRIAHMSAGRAGTRACAIARACRELMQRGPRRRTPVAAAALSNFIRLKFPLGSNRAQRRQGCQGVQVRTIATPLTPPVWKGGRVV